MKVVEINVGEERPEIAVSPYWCSRLKKRTCDVEGNISELCLNTKIKQGEKEPVLFRFHFKEYDDFMNDFSRTSVLHCSIKCPHHKKFSSSLNVMLNHFNRGSVTKIECPNCGTLKVRNYGYPQCPNCGSAVMEGKGENDGGE